MSEARTLELPAEASKRIEALQELSERAEGGDKEARRQLRKAVRESSPAVVARCSDFARTYRRVIAKTGGGGDPLIEDAVMTRAEMMRLEIAGESPTALEMLLTDRIVTLYMLTELLEALTTWQLSRDNDKRTSISYTLQMVKWQESVNRRYLAAIRELARVRKLQAGAERSYLRMDPRGSVLAGASAGLDAS